VRDRKSDAHRSIAAAKLGRPIKPGHDVDHLNENKQDNSPANLAETPHAEHSKKSAAHRGLAKLQKALSMVRRGEKHY
jgi:hypothetical protein